MANIRLIARLDIKGPNLIKGVHLEGLRKLGNPRDFAQRYYAAGIDELLYLDIVASLYDRNSLNELIKYTAEHIFIPMTVAGGVRSVADVDNLLRAGADKVAINTAATRRPELIDEVSGRFGSQCTVVGIEAKRRASGQGWEAFTDNGREHTGRDVVEWAREAADRGAGEILLTSIDQEGTRRGFDVELVRAVSEQAPIPVIASGGMGRLEDVRAVVVDGAADAVAMADVLHYGRLTVDDVRAAARGAGLDVRAS